MTDHPKIEDTDLALGRVRGGNAEGGRHAVAGHGAGSVSRELGRPFRFGDIVRLDPERYPAIRQPDNRRWIVLTAPGPESHLRSATMYLGESASIQHWTGLDIFMLDKGSPS